MVIDSLNFIDNSGSAMIVSSALMVAPNKNVNPVILKFFPDAQKVTILHGGAVNECYLVKTAAETYAFRMGVEDPSKYGFDRQQELMFYKEGERLAIAPSLKAFDVSKGILVMDYVDGKLVDKEIVRQTGMMAKVTTLLKSLHSVQSSEKPQAKTVQHILFFLEKLKEYQALPEGWEEYIKNLITEMRPPKKLVLCHNDLAFNIMYEKGRLWVIDWECAGWNDPIFDLAFLCLWYDFTDEEKKELLSLYYGEVSHEKELTMAIRLGLVFSSLWSLLEVVYGKPSYQKQALELYAKAQALSD